MIPDAAAVEAAAEAMLRESNQFKPASYPDMARAALTAALPLLEAEWRERVAQEIEAAVENNDDPPYAWGMDHAARIVRGGS